ncbi:MAG: reverse transcriptase domain-containing protein [Chloroflexi bacterium]|nr:reverse transcriptase domain-containing protein [Chloroflexota bacterium]
MGVPTWSDKLVQEVIRSILEPYYEQQFSEHSHGFRPQRGCHTALMEIQKNWTGVKWIVEGDISQYFDTIDHTALLNILKEKIDDNRFINLISSLLEAGYLEDWQYNKTYSGTPQGGVLSPLLANIYLDKLDKYVSELAKAYNHGTRRAPNLEYRRLIGQKCTAVKKGDKDKARALTKQMREIPSVDPNDPKYRRFIYIRYADDFMIGIIGPRSDAEEIKRKIGNFLQDNLKLNLSEEKTLITNPSEKAARFLAYELEIQYADDAISRDHGTGTPRRAINGRMALLVPQDVIQKKSKPYLSKGKPTATTYLSANHPYSIVKEYQMKLRGLYQYYALATNVCHLGYLRWIMQDSMMRTLAMKLKVSRRALYAKYGTRVTTKEGKSLRCIQVKVEREGKKPLVATFGGFSLERKRTWVIDDQEFKVINGIRTEILQRLEKDQCEICGSTQDVEVHHVKKISDVTGMKNESVDWKRRMASRNRKTLVVCSNCHHLIHAGKPLPVSVK